MKEESFPKSVDKPTNPNYTLDEARELLLSLLPHLENHTSNSQFEAKSGAKGASAMAKNYKQRVKVAIDDKGYPIYKWATGHNIDELNDRIVQLYVDFGLINRFTHAESTTLQSDKPHIPTFKEYTTKWFETFKKPVLKPTTQQGYRSNLRIHLYPFFGEMRLDEITTEDVQRFLNEREHLAKNTMHTIFVLLSEIMESAFEDRLAPSNPTKSKRLMIPSTRKKTRDALSPEQLKQIIRDIPEKLKDDTERRMMAIILFTGVRRGEMLGLRWEDFDYENHLINVRRAVSYTTNQPIVSTTKTASGSRVIPLDEQLVEFLKPIQSTGYVIGGEKPLTQTVYRRIQQHINDKIDLYGATPHTFRHSYISALVEAGVDLKTVQQISGHANVMTTMNIYTHTRTSRVQEAGQKVRQLLA